MGRDVYWLAKETVNEWLNHNAFRLAAALAYYTLFSLAPLLVVAVAMVGLVFGEEAVRGQLFMDLRGFIGDSSAATVQEVVAAAAVKDSGIKATLIGILTLFLGASAMFGELQDALNTMWNAKPDRGAGVRNILRKRLLSLAMVAVIGFLLLVSLILSAIVNALGTYLGAVLPLSAVLMELVNIALSFVITTVLFASIYKVLPDVDIEWGDVWTGAIATAAMFTFGKSLIGMYLGQTAVSSAYGAAGSLVVLLVWIYYSSLILYLGAEFTHVYAQWRGSHVGDDAVKTPPGAFESVRARERASAG